MSDLTEIEIFDCLAVNLREGAANCDLLAVLPAKGPTYVRLRDNLRLVEGACRQMGFFRDDMRYQVLGLQAAHCQEMAGGWLRDFNVHAPALFTKLGETLRKVDRDIDKMRHAATGRRGPILIPPLSPPHRDTRPVAVPASIH